MASWVSFFFGVGHDGAHLMAAFARDLYHWIVDPEPLYKAGGNPSGLDNLYAHKISLVWNPSNSTFYISKDLFFRVNCVKLNLAY